MNKNLKSIAIVGLVTLIHSQPANGMGLRSFVALPVDVNGKVVRFSYEHLFDSESNTFITSGAYGLASDKATFLGIPYKFSSNGKDSFGDLSALYRHTVLQDDFFSGTSRLGLLAGAIVPTDNDREPAIQAGFVYTYFKNRYEVDIDALYQAGVDNRPDSGRYDISMQYRLSPSIYSEWGMDSELNVVSELNGRWKEDEEVFHQVTIGLQLIRPTWVIEGGIIKGISNNYDTSVMLSARFHF